jgi:hypothetical protein
MLEQRVQSPWGFGKGAGNPQRGQDGSILPKKILWIKKEIKVQYRKQNNTQIIEVVIDSTCIYTVTREILLKICCCAAFNNDLDFTVFV